MALKKYRQLPIYREKVNELLNLLFPTEEIVEMEDPIDNRWNTAEVLFCSGKMNGIKGGIHNYVIHIDLPNSMREENPFFKKHQNFNFSEINTWVKSEGKRIRLYPHDRDLYEDNEMDLERRAYYFVTVLQIGLKWVENNIK